ncbi:hypothetical protein FRC11_014568, partial [Ceratobasidium sp. 423]
MSAIQIQPSPASIQRWEVASTHLMDSLTAYMNSCVNLATSSDQGISNSKNLASQIDSFHTTIENQLAQSRRILARTRNKLAATFYCIPGEILSEIFTLTMLGKDELKIPDLEHGIRAYYRRLYSLLSVCSVWHHVGISQGKFWTLIPMFIKRSEWLMEHISKLILGRAGGHRLHLAASIMKCASPAFMDTLKDPHHRFHAINITSDHLLLLHEALRLLLRSQDPHPLAELSVYHPSDPALTHYFPESDRYLNTTFGPPNPYEISLYLPSLRILRLRGVFLHWPDVTLTRVVELRLQSVTFRADSKFSHFMTCLTTAPQLRKLEIISVTRIRAPAGEDADTDMPLQVQLPSLQTLHVEDLYSDDIRPVITSIYPGSHHVSLCITDNSLMQSPNLLEGDVEHDLDILTNTIEGLTIHTLVLNGELADDGVSYWNWLNAEELREILRAAPSITTLKFHQWYFGKHQWQRIIHGLESHSLDDTPNFPALRSVHLSRAEILDIDGFKEFVSSHSLQRLIIGATIRPQIRKSPDELIPLQDSGDL